MTWFSEQLHDNYQLQLFVTKTLFRNKTDLQDLAIFENPVFGRVLTLDGVIQTTEGDEFIYHETLAHVPMMAHGQAKTALIVGGGDGGMLRRVLQHPGVQATLVEIDQGVIDLCREYLPSISENSFDHPRARVVIADGAKYMAEARDTYDVIIVDSTDPMGPGEVLFTAAFYADCKRRLNPNGILATQSGVPFLQKTELSNSYSRLKPLFADTGFFVAPVPTYSGGFMAFGWATDNKEARATPKAVIEERYRKAALETRYYNPDIHVASFALPNYIRDLMR
ncbi:MAG: polyamine aminopropyltransferase [Alphaproteobacteria bacterium]